MLIKEVYGTATAPMTTGTVSHAQTLKGWFVKDCLSCHVPAQSTDWVYTSGYPALK